MKGWGPGRSPRGAALRSALLPLLLYGSAGAGLLWWGHRELGDLQRELVVVLTLFALWRYGWQLLHYARGDEG